MQQAGSAIQHACSSDDPGRGMPFSALLVV